MSISRAFCLLAAILVACALRAVPAVAQDLAPDESERVAAVVNQDAITMYDLDARVRLGLLAASLPDTDENRRRIVSEVLRRMIDERLELQEADRLKITVPAADIDDRISEIEQQNKMPKGALPPFLKSHGIDPQTLREQIRAQIAWARVVRRELVPTLHVGEDEIDARLKELRANQGKPEFLAADLFLAVDDPRRDAQVRELADRLNDQLHQGAPFAALARQFSQSGAAAGGDLGWVSRGMIDDALFSALQQLSPGQASPPIRTSDGYHIVFLRGKRIAGQETVSEPSYDLAQVDLTTLPSATERQRQEQVEALQKSVARAKTCDDYERIIRSQPTAQFIRAGTVYPSDVGPVVNQAINDLKVGEISKPIALDNVYRFFIMCDRKQASTGTLSRDDIRRRIEDERTGLLAERYLRDLRRAAFVEIRV